MPPPDAARAHYREQQAIATATVDTAADLWAQVDPADIAGSWNTDIGPQVLARLTLTQLLVASRAEPYLNRLGAELGIDPTPVAQLRPRAFAGHAADGRSLAGLLHTPVVETRVALARGAPVADALTVGRDSLARIIGTEIADAGRTATATATAARPTMTRWVRMLNPPSCSRCAVLAGRVYRWNQGFARHPLCDCTHIPASENIAGDLTTSPQAYFDSLTAADQAKYFTVAGAEAIRQGADIGQVVNARRSARSLYYADGRLATLEGTTRRGHAGKVLQGRTRLMPESIIDSGAGRIEVIDGLRRHGYLA